MTARDALTLAQRIHPLDLVARLAYMNYKLDSCDPEDMGAWQDAISLTRNGTRT